MNGRNKAAIGTSGASKKRPELPKGYREAAQAETKGNQMVLVMDGRNLRKRWVRAKDLK